MGKRYWRSSSNSLFALIRNLVLGIVFYNALTLLYTKNQGYNWVLSSLLAVNVNFIDKHYDLTFNQKKESKLGFNFKYLKLIVDNSPDSAILLLPFNRADYEQKDIKLDDFPKPRIHIMNKSYVSSHIYPRKAVTVKDYEDKTTNIRTTHVAIISGIGYQYLSSPYLGKEKPKHAFIPGIYLNENSLIP
ncbi:MAG: hypothetical protein JKY48_05895 [Flavobacteriales bacterium]|nr:hypothetical protein [Flavobacteriales bacterium]